MWVWAHVRVLWGMKGSLGAAVGVPDPALVAVGGCRGRSGPFRALSGVTPAVGGAVGAVKAARGDVGVLGPLGGARAARGRLGALAGVKGRVVGRAWRSGYDIRFAR